MIFAKEFFSIDETLDILNKFTEGKTNLTQKYIKDLFLEGKLDLRINVKLISSYGVEFFNNKEYEVPFSLIDTNNVFQNNSLRDEDFYIDLTLTEDGDFYGTGNLRIVSDNCSIIEQGRTFSILVSSFDIYASYKEYVSYDNNHKPIDTDKDLYVELYTETPILIDFKDVLIHIKSLLNTIKLINEITEHSIEYLSNINVKVKNTELEQQPEELKQKPAQATQPPTVGNSKNYNPTERETHLQIIYWLVEKLTKKDINHSKYQRGNKINKMAIANDLERELQGLFITPKTAEGFRNRLTEILKEAESPKRTRL